MTRPDIREKLEAYFHRRTKISLDQIIDFLVACRFIELEKDTIREQDKDNLFGKLDLNCDSKMECTIMYGCLDDWHKDVDKISKRLEYIITVAKNNSKECGQ